VDGKPVDVIIKESDMIMTKGDIGRCGGRVGIYLALARVTGVLFQDRGIGGSTCNFKVRGVETRIYVGWQAKEEAASVLDDFCVSGRRYEEMKEDEHGGRVKVTRVGKDGWWMKPEHSFSHPVFVPLPAKVAKMGVVGSLFSGMRLALASDIWRPVPTQNQRICYNVYPPSLNEFEQ
jgi:hypothetical protein